MTKKIFGSIIAVAIVVLFSCILIAGVFLFGYFNNSQADKLKNELDIVASNVEKVGIGYFETFDSSVFRFTLVGNDGTVLYDSQAQVESMENHLQRKEIADAAEKGRGSSARYSKTLTQRTFYEAVLLEDGNILRISISQITLGALVLEMLPAICVIVAISAIVALVLSRNMAKSIVKPLNEMDLENPIENDVYDELSPILIKLDRQQKQIAQHMAELRQRADEFEQITTSMTEALVLLDKNGTVISLNTAACTLFDTDETAVGKSFFTIDRSVGISESIEKAFEGSGSELCKEKGGRQYQLMVNRIASDNEIVGAVILGFDITERASAERSRREFTANVSHELKTPLQSIIGSAELLESGLVKPEDTQRFLGNIKSEATRLVSLINDIIRISQLDEGSAPTFERVDLYEVATDVAKALQEQAEKKEVVLSCKGEHCEINGIHRYVHEIIYNLCDNAIRYNKQGGNVKISVSTQGTYGTVTVSDTGIGIEEEHHNRIFERFYRVDKSHSRDTGGTGLGLSIVKHAVAFHGGTIKLKSKVGEGTEITVSFKINQ